MFRRINILHGTIDHGDEVLIFYILQICRATPQLSRFSGVVRVENKHGRRKYQEAVNYKSFIEIRKALPDLQRLKKYNYIECFSDVVRRPIKTYLIKSVATWQHGISDSGIHMLMRMLRYTAIEVEALRDRTCDIRRHFLLACAFRGRFGHSILMCTIKNEKFKTAEQLVRFGADVHAKNGFGLNALQYAVTTGSETQFQKVAPDHSDSLDVDFKHSCFLAFFSMFYDEESIRSIARRKLNRCDSDDRLSLVKTLLKAGSNVNNESLYGCSPIQCAVYQGDLELMKTLIDAGADIENKNVNGTRALNDAILLNNKAMIRLLLSHGAKVDARDSRGNTPLHWAVKFNKNNSQALLVLKELSKYSPNPNIQNFEGDSPLHCIIRYADLDMVRYFIDEFKVDIAKKEQTGRKNTTLQCAIHNEHEDVFNFVRETVDPKCQTRNMIGQTALHHAARHYKPKYVRALLDNGADVAETDIWDSTPLFLCIKSSLTGDDRNKKIQTISALLEYGSDVNLKFRLRNNRNTTILQEAIVQGDAETSALILLHAAEVEARTEMPVFDDFNLAVIDDESNVKSYYEDCRAEVAAMRNRQIKDTSFTYFDVLTKPLDVVARFTKNEKAVEEFGTINYYEKAYPIYGWKLKAKFDEAVDRQKLFENVATTLCAAMQFSHPEDAFFENLFKYLSKEDVKILVGT